MKTELKRRATRKHFRYLNKQEVLDPIKYLNDFFTDQTDINYWRTEVELLLLSGLDGKLRRNGLDYGFIAQRLIKHIEIAYIFYKEGNIKQTTLYKPHLKKKSDIRSFFKHYEGKQPIKEILYLFFKYQSLKDWCYQIDEILCNASVALKKYHPPILIDSLLIYHYTKSLINALHQIHLDGGLAFYTPSFIFKKEEPVKTSEVKEEVITE